MPLSAPAPREHLHTRKVECQGFRRTDGLWDIEGRITDTKTYGFRNHGRGTIEPGMAIHDMWIRLTVDEHLVIHGVEAVTDASPFSICPNVTPNFQRLIGVSISKGFRKAVRERLGGTEGCTHLVELLGPVGTTAFQTVFPVIERERRQAKEKIAGGEKQKSGPPALIDTCYAFGRENEVIKENWPELYTPKGTVQKA